MARAVGVEVSESSSVEDRKLSGCSKLTVDDFQAVADKTPYLADLKCV